MTPKQKRIVERDVESLFSLKAFVPNPSMEDIKQLGFFHPTIEYKRGTFLLSERGVAALRQPDRYRLRSAGAARFCLDG